MRRGLPTTTANLLTMPILEAMRVRYPKVMLLIREGVSGDMAELVMKGRVDFAVLFLSDTVPGLDVTPLWVEELLLVAPPDAVMPKRISFADATRLAWSCRRKATARATC